jgi:preprotein translocase subunit SecE
VRNKTWVAIFFVAAALIVGWVLHLAAQSVFAALRITDSPILGDRVTTTTLIGFAVAAAVAVALYMWPKTQTFVTEVAGELNKVNWPTWSETKVNTLVVIVTSVIAALILGVFDITFGYASTWLSTRF